MEKDTREYKIVYKDYDEYFEQKVEKLYRLLGDDVRDDVKELLDEQTRYMHHLMYKSIEQQVRIDNLLEVNQKLHDCLKEKNEESEKFANKYDELEKDNKNFHKEIHSFINKYLNDIDNDDYFEL
ncbi:hypothetical protein [Ligilactobacillus equi]|uniref:ATP-dependent DNA helicase PcrA n=2 Tax=Ligilactobacillus equi TaxID=137357 RepID=V7HWE0_9LACO|nr:hypothetical protein [Ligilactobacillus equi]ETA74564.1 ATP-dependent DNA helicase PcrA [Ligilactobacillus equi DPC 6820]KRL84347.1 hypothetical protein FC36_GL000270 [Ligilactobacillus equi DSM 15833 = JCM 10991]